MIDIITIQNSENEVIKKREKISKLFLLRSINVKSEAISKISEDDIRVLYDLYDEIFFDNYMKNSFKGKFKFSLSKRMTKSAGLTICPKNIERIKQEELIIEIRLGVEFFFNYNMVEGAKKVCGVETSKGLEALQLVFEHELCHVIEFILYNKSNCSKERFKTLAHNIFGHTESYHSLPTYQSLAKQRMGINIGDIVSFNYEDKLFKGILYRINKRATVMVKDNNGSLTDRTGNRYSKYYVPLNKLKL